MNIYHLKSAVIFKASGKDARRYLNSRLTNDIKTLKEEFHLTTGMVSPQGKTQGVFEVIQIGQDEFMLVADGGERDKLLAALRQFIVADRVVVEDLTEKFLLYHVYSNSPSEYESFSRAAPEKNRIQRHGTTILFLKKRTEHSGGDLIWPGETASSVIQDLFTETKETSEAEWQVHTFRSMRPTFPRDIPEGSLFSSAGMESVIAMDKGCYVGQEVIEKIDSHGKLPLRTVFVRHTGAIILDTDSMIELKHNQGTPKNVGSVISSCYDKERDMTYAFVELRQQIEGFQIDSMLIGGQTEWHL